jgi:hypothetical protein
VSLRHFAHRQQLARHGAIPRLHPLQLWLGPQGHQLVERQARQVEVEVPGQDGQAALERHQAVVQLLLLARLFRRRADDRLQAERWR